ncbi:ABC transporter [Penicillium robsamsonii]|uniref:ABC transporter n=1 Tax=Penicillium robsamsonii TaxID=1792511 RepID=UPI0025497F21|nr:ABC transporter [Penicillium robsamsonii]KAJ5824200.1 ABC transporter [Penicillium robsamsonii]
MFPLKLQLSIDSGAPTIPRETCIPASAPWLALAIIHRSLWEPLVKLTGHLIYWTTPIKAASNNGDNDYQRHMVLEHLSFEARSSSVNFVVSLVACEKTT